jgi:uncharacterized membrane protein YoaK (UPF0700 family)
VGRLLPPQGLRRRGTAQSTAQTCGLAPPLEHLDVAGGDEFAVLLQPGLIVFPRELHRFGGECSQLDEIGVLQRLEFDVSVHGCTITHWRRTWREPLQIIPQLRRKRRPTIRNQFTGVVRVLSYLRIRLQCAMPQSTHTRAGISRIAWILFATAFAAGAVDIIGFANLGGVFASAMTGNFALLAYHFARGNTLSAIGSVIALVGFVTGCVIGFTLPRGRAAHTTVNLLLGCEAGLLLFFALYSFCGAQMARIPAMRLQIVILAVAMGLQAVVGQMVSLSTIVFTTTLTRLVGGIADAIANRSATGLGEVRDQMTLVASYLFGALLAGILAVHKIGAVVFLPLGGVAVAFTAHFVFRGRQTDAAA